MEARALHVPPAAPRRAARSIAAAVTATAPVLAITIAGAVLRLWSFSQVPPNNFYDAAVRSMALSWHNVFFGAYEPGGQVSIDKIPVDLWFQVASVKLLGFTAYATRVPEVAAGILAIPLVFDLVRRLFGRTAGLGAAAALAVLPTAILTAHSDTMDSMMMLLDLMAAWLVVIAAQRRRVWPVVLAGVLVGVAFNVKIFEALLICPALAVLAVLALDLPIRRRILAAVSGSVAFAASALSWTAIASITPLAGRPWPIGSTDGTIWNVVFWFNGIDRLRQRATPAALAMDPPGALRFFQGHGHDYGMTVGSMLLGALVLGAAALAVEATCGRPLRGFRLQVTGAVFLGIWLVAGVALLSHMQRFQPRYLETVTPAIAAVLGVAVARLATGAGGRRARFTLTAAAAIAAVGGASLWRTPGWAAAAALGGAAACALLAVPAPRRFTGSASALAALVATLAVPAAGAVTVARQHHSDAGLPSRVPPAQLATLSSFLKSRQHGAFYEVASPTVARAAPLIVRDVRPVLMLTSLYGRPLLTPSRLKALVAAGKVRYAMLGAACPRRGTHPCAPVIHWAIAHGRDVSRAAGLPPRSVYRLSVGRVRPPARRHRVVHRHGASARGASRRTHRAARHRARRRRAGG